MGIAFFIQNLYLNMKIVMFMEVIKKTFLRLEQNGKD